MNDLKGIVKDLENSSFVDNDFFMKMRLSDEEAVKSYSGCTTNGEVIILLKSQQKEIEELNDKLKATEPLFTDYEDEMKCPCCSDVVDESDSPIQCVSCKQVLDWSCI